MSSFVPHLVTAPLFISWICWNPGRSFPFCVTYSKTAFFHACWSFVGGFSQLCADRWLSAYGEQQQKCPVGTFCQFEYLASVASSLGEILQRL